MLCDAYACTHVAMQIQCAIFACAYMHMHVWRVCVFRACESFCGACVRLSTHTPFLLALEPPFQDVISYQREREGER